MVQPRIKSLFYISRLLIIILSIAITGPAFCEILLKENALEYRQKGSEAQKAGMLQEALGFYQKALLLDPASAVIFNDLAVVYEMLGQIENAEKAYGQAVAIDPNYGKPYFNLALLYESRGNLRKALEYWLKLASLGGQEESMIGKAKDKVYELAEIFPDMQDKISPLEAAHLDGEVRALKDEWAMDNNELAQSYIKKAEIFAKKKDYPQALHMYLKAKQLDPQDKQIDELIETAQKMLLL